MINATMTFQLVLENQLAAFIAELAVSPAKLELYKTDPEAAMSEAGLAEVQKEVLRGGDWQTICAALGDPGVRPLLSEQGNEQGGGGG